MRKRLYLKKKHVTFFRKKTNIIVIILIGIICSIIAVFSFINKKLTPIIMDYAELQAGRVATLVINQAITKEVTNEIDIDDLFLIVKDGNGKIKSIDFNPIVVNKMLSMVTSNVQLYLQNLEDGNLGEIGLTSSNLGSYGSDKLNEGIIFEIPSGVIF